MEVWEPAYGPTPLLEGTWDGAISTARGPLRFRLIFGADSVVRFRVGEEGPEDELRGPVFNRFGRLEGGLDAVLPTSETVFDTEAVSASLKLQVRDDAAVGYLLPRFGTECGAFAIPLAVRLVRTRALEKP